MSFTAVAGEKDYTNVSLAEIGVTHFSPKKDDKTGFTIGGKSPTDLIRKLTEVGFATLGSFS